MNKKRDIFRFGGDKPTAIDLGHVNYMVMDGKRITFTFLNASIFIDLEDEEKAKLCFEQLLTAWVADAVGTQQAD